MGLLGDRHFESAALRNIAFVLSRQAQDGSWLYADGNPKDAFVDHFHTCFVLKNLVKINRRLKRKDIQQTIQAGYQYYRKNLFDDSDDPKPFALKKGFQIMKYEMYDFAEAITLGVLLRDEIDGACDMARQLAEKVTSNYQLSDGHFVTRVYKKGFRNTMPYLRWPQAQMFYALTNLLKVG